MSALQRVAWALSVSTMVLALAELAGACNVPVFRYALENWQPDNFQVLVVSRGPLSAEQKQWVARLQPLEAADPPPANLRVRVIDLARSSLGEQLPAELLENPLTRQGVKVLDDWLSQQSLSTPHVLILYPQIWDRLAWQGELTAEHVDQLLDSPLRQEIANRLLAGHSSVWVLLDSGDADRDEQAWQTLQSELARTSRIVELPDRQLIESDEFYRPEVPIDLRVEFSAIRLSATDKREQILASMLRGSEPDLRDFSEPIAIPIYGRGRTYFALVGSGINAGTIEDTGRFLCGACSCQVKDDNPGLDMLMSVNWAGRIQGTAMPPVVLPELTGIGGLDLATQSTAKVQSTPTAEVSDDVAKPATAGKAQETVVARVDLEAAPSPRPQHQLPPTLETRPSPRSSWSRVLILGVGGLSLAVVLLGLATFWLRRAD